MFDLLIPTILDAAIFVEQILKEEQAFQLERREKGREAHKGLATQLALRSLEKDEAQVSPPNFPAS